VFVRTVDSDDVLVRGAVITRRLKDDVLSIGREPGQCVDGRRRHGWRRLPRSCARWVETRQSDRRAEDDEA
jgi:hypothetical protein